MVDGGHPKNKKLWYLRNRVADYNEILHNDTYYYQPVHQTWTLYRRRRSRASPVLTAISLVNGKPWEPSFLTPHKIDIT